METVVAPYSCRELYQKIDSQLHSPNPTILNSITDVSIDRMRDPHDRSSRTINGLRDLFFDPDTNHANMKVVDFIYDLVYKLSARNPS